MKKLISVFIISLSCGASFSCKKSYECVCHTASGGHEHTHIAAAKKSDAETECNAKAAGTYTACGLE